jgi:cation diffusion facilitator family transporter
LIAAVLLRGGMSVVKFRVARRIDSSSLVADAWNDVVDILSATVALIAITLVRYDPERFSAADHYGGFAVGVVVVLTGIRLAKDASLELMDTTPERELLDAIASAALSVPGVLAIEKNHARKSGLQYHVDLHIEVDPNLTVGAAHQIAGQVRSKLRSGLPWIADVLVHIEPFKRTV